MIGRHRWQLMHVKDDGSFWRRCRDCGKERLPPAIKQQYLGL
jgi:hypothetical protein